ncbi:MAG: uroporphyrinogen-III synthase [Bacteroidota bacterium]
MQVFITRSLKDCPFFDQQLSAFGWEVSGLPLIQLSPLPFEIIPSADWIFFSSGNGVRFFFQTLEAQNIQKPLAKWAAIGPATATALAEFVDPVDFTGTGDPDTTIASFIKQVKTPSVLFAGARNARMALRNKLSEHTLIRSLDVYDNRPISDPPLSNAAVMVFTSPMNAEAYFAAHQPNARQTCVAIGKSTAAALRTFGITQPLIPEAPTEESLVALLCTQFSV